MNTQINRPIPIKKEAPPLNILVVSRTSSYHHFGGFEDHMDTLYTGLAQRGHHITIVTTKHPKNIPTLIKNNIQFIFLDNTTPGEYSKHWWTESSKKVQSLLNQKSYDLIHSQSYGGRQILVARLNQQFNIPVICSFHGTNYDEHKTRLNLIRYNHHFYSPLTLLNEYIAWKKKYHTFDKACFQQADGLIATSDEQKTIFQKIYRVPENKITVIYNGMAIKNFYFEKKNAALLTRYKLKNNMILLALARLESDKGIQFIIKAMPAIIKANKNIKLVIVGAGSYQDYLKTLVKGLKVDSHVIFTGKVPFSELRHYFNLCDIFINYTLRQNGYDLTLIEAMACEKALIASQIGSHPTLIKHNKNGILVPLLNIKKLAEAVLNLCANQIQRNALGQAAKKTVSEAFTAEHMVQQTEQLFQSLANR